MSLTTINLSPATQRWLRNSPVTPYILIYLDYLTGCRYADETSEHHLAGLAHLGLWMGLNHFRIEELNEALVTQFLDDHLPNCDCPRPIFQTRADLNAACGHFLRILRDRGVIPPLPRPVEPVYAEVDRFDDYLSDVRGLVSETRRNYRRIALLPNRDGQSMTRNNVTQRLSLAVIKASKTVNSLLGRHVSPHCIRHSTAMHLLQSGVDISVIALWLGHESPKTTYQYVEADLAMKDQALAKLQEPGMKPLRYTAPDSLLQFLKSL